MARTPEQAPTPTPNVLLFDPENPPKSPEGKPLFAVAITNQPTGQTIIYYSSKYRNHYLIMNDLRTEGHEVIRGHIIGGKFVPGSESDL